MRPASRRFSAAVAIGSVPGRWATTPIARRTRSGSAATSIPATRAEPESAAARVERIFTVVDLPAPFGPRSPNTVPGAARKLNPRNALTGGLFLPAE